MAGGRGTRLMPLTNNRPKPMVPVLGRPVLDYVKDAMVGAGLKQIVVTTGYKGKEISSHVESWNRNDVVAWVNQESTPMGTAGSVRLLMQEIEETIVVGSGDSVASFDVMDLIETHKKHQAAVTMAIWEVEDPTEYGIVGLSDTQGGRVDGNLKEGFIVKFKEKPSAEEAFSRVINAGLYIIEPHVIEMIPEGEKYDFSKQLFPMVLEAGLPMYAKTIDGIWFDVGHPLELLKAQKALIQNKDKLPFPMPSGRVLDDGSFISSTAEVRGQVFSSVISGDCVITENSVVKNSLIMQGTIFDGVAETSVVGENCNLKGVDLHDAVIGDFVNETSLKIRKGKYP